MPETKNGGLIPPPVISHINEIALAIAPFTYNSKGYFSKSLISSIVVTSGFTGSTALLKEPDQRFLDLIVSISFVTII